MLGTFMAEKFDGESLVEYPVSRISKNWSSDKTKTAIYGAQATNPKDETRIVTMSYSVE